MLPMMQHKDFLKKKRGQEKNSFHFSHVQRLSSPSKKGKSFAKIYTTQTQVSGIYQFFSSDASW